MPWLVFPTEGWLLPCRAKRRPCESRFQVLLNTPPSRRSVWRNWLHAKISCWIFLLHFGKDLLDETVTKPVQGLLYPAYINKVIAYTEDQSVISPGKLARAVSIRARIRFTVLSRLLKIASPMRKWPMLSSAISGIAAIGATVSNPRPCPAWHSRPSETAWAAARCIRPIHGFASLLWYNKSAGMQLNDGDAQRFGSVKLSRIGFDKQ